MGSRTAFFLVCIAGLCLNFGIDASIAGYLSPSDKSRLLSVLQKGLSNEETDATSIYYVAKGYSLLKITIPSAKEHCEQLKKKYSTDLSLEDTFQILSSWSILGCAGKLHTESTVQTLKTALESDKSTTADIHHALAIFKLIGQPVPNAAKVVQLLQAKLKNDDSLPSVGHFLHAASLLGTAGKFASGQVSEIVDQADEVDGKLLQWEGGLTTTSLLLTGVLSLPGGKALTQEQAEKFANYLLTRRTVQTPKGALGLIEAVVALASSDVSPVSITIVGSGQVSTASPDLKVHISDILGNAFKTPPGPVTAQSATRILDDVVVLSKQPFSPTSDPAVFSLTLRLDPGQYRIALSAGSHSSSLKVRVVGAVTLDSFEIGISDTDSASLSQVSQLKYPGKLSTVLKGDSNHHLIVKFSLSRVVHQAFLRLFSATKEIIFVAEPDSSKNYKVDVNLGSELTHSGVFTIELILGDSIMSNSIKWEIGSIDVTLSNPEPAKKVTRGPKPEIVHLFRPAEKRPPEAVSLLFTALTAAPLLLLFALWLKIGVNFGNFRTIAIPFHLGFGGILGLFTLFWLKLDMFVTCAWLIPIGGFTFIAGQKLLSSIAKQKVVKQQ